MAVEILAHGNPGGWAPIPRMTPRPEPQNKASCLTRQLSVYCWGRCIGAPSTMHPVFNRMQGDGCNHEPPSSYLRTTDQRAVPAGYPKGPGRGPFPPCMGC